ncbi:MAG: hypothetical protein UZ14_CFX002001609 [Chloroflexi bacterium OLB14]|nr:MAG: hypothetical protein UZ14_CFX002001609 [Chloroflexi bacterium OLB14]
MSHNKIETEYRDKTYLGDILDSIRRIEGYIHKVNKKAFLENLMMQDAVMRQIEIIGEASNNVSAEFQEKYDHLPWSQMRAIRNKIVHDYRGINIEIIWDTVKKDLPILKEQVSKFLGE